VATSGEVTLKRAIEGQATKLARSVHNIRYDAVHDEILVGNPVAQAVTVFRGGADGEEAPIRIIQGSRTMLWDPDHVDVDPVHNEIFVPEGHKILVFPREAEGNVAPIRVIEGPDTKLVEIRGIVIDPVHELIIVTVDRTYGPSTDSIHQQKSQDGEGAVLIFNRTDNGNVKPRGMIGPGPITNFYHINELAVSPKGWIVVPMSGSGGITDAGSAIGSRQIGIWSVNDNGDVPPHWILGGPTTKLPSDRNVTLNPEAKELIVFGDGGFAGYSLPEIF